LFFNISEYCFRYHNREAVVISALQVEKHPIATPGPYTPPSISRHYMLQANPSPMASPLPKPAHYSPKMKLRYFFFLHIFNFKESCKLIDLLYIYIKKKNIASIKQ